MLDKTSLPMRLKLLAGLVLVAGVGCTGVPTIQTSDTPAGDSARSLQVQGLVKAEVESAEVVPSENQFLRAEFPIGVFVVPAEQAGTIPAGAQKYPLVPIPEDEDPLHLQFAAEDERPTHIAYSAPDSRTMEALVALTTVTRGETPATRQTLEHHFLLLQFPKGSTGPVTLHFPPESHYYGSTMLSKPGDAIVKFALSQQVELPDIAVAELPNPHDARITFQVTDAENRGVPGIPRAFFLFYAYPKPESGESAYLSPTPFDALTELGGGRYRIETLLTSKEAHGTMRLRVEVVNPTAIATGSFYRR